MFLGRLGSQKVSIATVVHRHHYKISLLRPTPYPREPSIKPMNERGYYSSYEIQKKVN